MPNPARRQTDTRTALDAFMAQKAAIDALLADLMLRSDDHFLTDPDAVTWSHVASLDHLRAQLQEAGNSAP